MKEVVPTQKYKEKQGKTKEITLVLTAGLEWRQHADNQMGFKSFIDAVGDRYDLTEHGLRTIFLGTWYLWNKDAVP